MFWGEELSSSGAKLSSFGWSCVLWGVVIFEDRFVVFFGEFVVFWFQTCSVWVRGCRVLWGVVYFIETCCVIRGGVVMFGRGVVSGVELVVF